MERRTVDPVQFEYTASGDDEDPAGRTRKREEEFCGSYEGRTD